MRQRGLAALVTRELLGVALSLAEIPRLKNICGIGLSDPEGLAEKLGARFDYTNTFYHREPELDIQNPGSEHKGRYDFIICSEVMEHVPGSLDAAFSSLYSLLKPDSFLVLTVPYRLGDGVDEHFPHLNDFSFAQVGGETVLLNKTQQGELQVHRDLCFHGGDGSTLELRLFSESALLSLLKGAGFDDVHVCTDGFPEFGVRFADKWSLPIVARKGRFKLPDSDLAVVFRYAAHASRELEIKLTRELATSQADFMRFAEFHRASVAESERQMAEREAWVMQVEERFERRSAELLAVDEKKNAALADMHQALSSNAQAWERVAQLERELSWPTARIRSLVRRMGGRLARMFQRN